MNNQDKEYLVRESKNNTPNIFFPIVNTIFGVAFFIFLIVLTIQNDFKVGVLILTGFLVILFIVSSWYKSYFSKKKNLKRIYNFQEEAQLMFEYGKTLKKKTQYIISNDFPIEFQITLQDDIVDTNFSFDIKSRTFNPLTLQNKGIVMITLGLSFAGVAVDIDEKRIIGIIGMAPCSIWVKKRLKVPVAKRGKVNIDFKSYDVNPDTFFQHLSRDDIYYDTKVGWLCFGSHKTTPLDEVIEVAKDIYVVIREKDLLSLWVKIDDGLQIY